MKGAGWPGRVLRDAVVLPGDVSPREGRAWLVDWRGTRGVLRSLRVSADPAGRCRLGEELAWLHSFLDWLAATGFPAPKPLRAFGNGSWTVAEGALWELVSFLPGRVVGWADQPAMEEVGALLGRYHETVRHAGAISQRPGALPMADVPAVLRLPRLRAAHIGPGCATQICELAEDLARDLADIAGLAGPPVVVHGDFTNHNVLADGSPPRLTGVIDFAGAHVEGPVADIGYGLWRSGRPYQEADHLDLSRVRRFLRGYAGAVHVSADQARLIPVYLYGRGLQMIAKRIRAGRAETGMLAEVRWLRANADAIAATCVDALA
jgi:Ser/Thr protein kinase RdoA (MazF antagonist)